MNKPYTELEIQGELDMFYNVIDFDNNVRKTLIDFLKILKTKGEMSQPTGNKFIDHMYNFIKSSPNNVNDNEEIRANNIINTIERFLQRNIVFVQEPGNTYLRDMYKISQFIIGTQTLITLVGEMHESIIKCKNDIPTIGIDDFAVRQLNNDFSEIYLEIPEHVDVNNYNEVGSIPVRDIFSKLQQINKIDKIKKMDIRAKYLKKAHIELYQMDFNTFEKNLTKFNISPKNDSQIDNNKFTQKLSAPFFTIDINKIIQLYINPFILFYNDEINYTNFNSYLNFLRSEFENLQGNLVTYNIVKIRDILQQLWAKVTDYNILKGLLKHNPMIVNKIIIVGLAHYDNIFNILNDMKYVSLVNKQEVSSDTNELNCIQLYSVVEWSNMN